VTGAWPGPAFGAAVRFGGQRTGRIAGPALSPISGQHRSGRPRRGVGGLLWVR